MLLSIAVVLISLYSHSNAAPYFGCSNRENDDNLRSVFLDFHNEARRRVARGAEKGVQGKVGPAKNMYQLRWNCEMEQKAQDYLRTCNANVQNLGSYAGNIITVQTTGRFGDPRPMIDKTLQSWWSTVQRVGLGPDNKFSNSALYSFANMVYSGTTEIGCAYKICGGVMQVLCLYDDIGYITGQVLFEKGKPCEKNDDCTTYKNSRCENKLCVKPEEAPDDGRSYICEGYTGMTDKIRNKMLEMHNDYRSLVATGKARNKTGFAPRAADMRELKYDCELERIAAAHARRCMFQHSNRDTRQGTGENLYTIYIRQANKLKTGERACRSWFDELKEYGVGKQNVFNSELLNAVAKERGQIGHYTQMVWANTEYVGCGIQHCSDETLVVCNYKKAGNFLTQPIYKKGEPCSKCPRDYTCTKDKLCARN